MIRIQLEGMPGTKGPILARVFDTIDEAVSYIETEQVTAIAKEYGSITIWKIGEEIHAQHHAYRSMLAGFKGDKNELRKWLAIHLPHIMDTPTRTA